MAVIRLGSEARTNLPLTGFIASCYMCGETVNNEMNMPCGVPIVWGGLDVTSLRDSIKCISMSVHASRISQVYFYDS
jgi:hypothetical protein